MEIGERGKEEGRDEHLCVLSTSFWYLSSVECEKMDHSLIPNPPLKGFFFFYFYFYSFVFSFTPTNVITL